jgi:hypothetical protein
MRADSVPVQRVAALAFDIATFSVLIEAIDFAETPVHLPRGVRVCVRFQPSEIEAFLRHHRVSRS